MKNRQNLHDYGLALIFVGILNLFMFGSTIVAGIIDGSVAEALATVEADMLGAVKVLLGIIYFFTVFLVAADVLLGIKALKVSKNPTAKKGYIIVAMVFLAMSVIATISHINGLIGGNANVVDAVLNVANSALNVCIYVLFIKSAYAVRNDVLIAKK